MTDDPDFLDVNCVDYGFRMRTVVSMLVFSLLSWAGIIFAIRRVLGG